ncbi:MAG TPA: DinB family protein [Actinomycetota bacterium]|jgi:uncharacterized damage-inducible protein DinB|nr:DinB family protein [Actinomycetota bacterium]
MRYGAPVAGGEKEVLAGFLDHYRSTMLEICSGLSEDQLRRAMVPSGTSLLGMIHHLVYVERGWFDEAIAGLAVDYPFDEDDPDVDFRVPPDMSVDDVFDLYRQQCARSREILKEVALDDQIKGEARSADYNVRWVVVHMIEETARHAGHADILREQIDGATGTGYST